MKMGIQEVGWGNELETGSCECGNGPSVSIKSGEFHV